MTTDRNSFFTSKREKQLWIWLAVVMIAIYSTLGLAGAFADTLRERGILSQMFSAGFLLVLATIATQGLRKKPDKFDIGITMGIAGVYLIVFARMGVPEERSHIIEYSIVAVFIFEALKERVKNGKKIAYLPLVTIAITSLLGFFDEIIQFFLPNRVFDWFDVLFNFLASILAVGGSVALTWGRQMIEKQLIKRK